MSSNLAEDGLEALSCLCPQSAGIAGLATGPGFSCIVGFAPQSLTQSLFQDHTAESDSQRKGSTLNSCSVKSECVLSSFI